jgi:hypothetical protein
VAGIKMTGTRHDCGECASKQRIWAFRRRIEKGQIAARKIAD